jgi:hypothetical protein
MYPTDKDVKNVADRDHFMRVVRGHENYLESNAQTFFAIIANWVILKNYSTVFVASAVIAVARVAYAYSYSISPSARGPAFGLALLGNAALQGALAWFVVKRFL